MLLKGTKTRSSNEIAQKIQDVGGYVNAYTSFDRTVFWIDVPKDGVSTSLDILSDAMMNSTLPAEEYQKEQEVIRREFAMGWMIPIAWPGYFFSPPLISGIPIGFRSLVSSKFITSSLRSK